MFALSPEVWFALLTCAADDFLWLRLDVDSVVRDDLDRAASWNVARAGVDGLLARPLFVVTVAIVVVVLLVTGGAGAEVVVATGAGTDGAVSAFFSVSSGFGGGSFLVEVDAETGLSAFTSGSFAVVAVATSGGLGASLGSSVGLESTVGTTSGVLGRTPLGLFEAEDDGRALLFPLLLVAAAVLLVSVAFWAGG